MADTKEDLERKLIEEFIAENGIKTLKASDPEEYQLQGKILEAEKRGGALPVAVYYREGNPYMFNVHKRLGPCCYRASKKY